ncbi:MAG: LuxR C-terminal-related transcriptional regulator [Mycobacteriales bacterium]
MLLLDDDGYVRDALVRRLNDAGYSVLEAVSLDEAKRKAGNKPVAALIDISLASMQEDKIGLRAAKKIKAVSPETLCMVITTASEDSLPLLVYEAMNGPEAERFDGFAHKLFGGPDHIIEAFKQLMVDKYYVEPRLGKFVAGDPAKQLTAGEVEVLRGIEDGDHVKVIAERLNLTQEAVKKRYQSAKRKLGARGRGQAGVVKKASSAGYLRDAAPPE